MNQLPTIASVQSAFQIYPSHCHQLICRGVLPKHPRGHVSVAYVKALAEYIRTRRGSIPPAGVALLAAIGGAE